MLTSIVQRDSNKAQGTRLRSLRIENSTDSIWMQSPSSAQPSRPSCHIPVSALRLQPEQSSKNPNDQDTIVASACDYLERNRIWDLFASLMERLIIDKPTDPLSYLIEELKYPASTMKVVVIGGTRGGKSSLCMNIAREFKTELVIASSLLDIEAASGSEAGETIRACRQRNEPVSADLTATVLKRALDGEKCKLHGWVLDNFPTTRRQAEAMLRAGILPNKVIVVDRGVIDSEMNNTLDLFKGDFCVIGDVTLPMAWSKAREYLMIPEPSRAPKRSPP